MTSPTSPPDGPSPHLRGFARPACGRTRLVALAALLGSLAGGCSESSATAGPPGTAPTRVTTDPPDGPLLEREIGDLVAALTPPAATATSAVQDDWLRARRRTLERMASRSPEFGLHVLEAYRARPDDIVPIRAGLLEAAAITNPEATRAELVRLVDEYGDDLGLRTDACRLLGESSPSVALELLPKRLMNPEHSATAPPDEAMLAGWMRACELLDVVPLPELAHLATDLQRDQATRHLAVRSLGSYPSKITQAALVEVLRESTGNAYLRRLAAQTLVKVGEFETVCPILQRTFDHEADVNFQLFLESVIQEHCP
jgi:hypothetical protein